MTLPSKHKWFALTILAIIIPTGLLTAFKLTGIIPESSSPQIVQCAPAKFEMERPSTSLELVDQRVENAYADNEAVARIAVHASIYHENSPIGPYFYKDGITYIVLANFAALHGSSFSLVVKYLPTDGNASVYIDDDFTVQNVSVTERKWFGNSANEAYVEAEILNSPCYLRTQGYWVFSDENIMEHQLNVTLEVIYYNETAYRRIVLPVQLYVWTDAGNSFQEAKHIDVGNYTGFLGYNDLEDYYKLWIEEGQTIFIRMQHQTNIDLDLYLFDPNKDLLASPCLERPEVTESIIITTEASGWYYIKVSNAGGFGLYTLEVIS